MNPNDTYSIQQKGRETEIRSKTARVNRELKEGTICSRRKEENITQEKIKAFLSYDPLTGIFTRRITVMSGHRGTRWKQGQPVGSVTNTGYISIWIFGEPILAHRLAWLYVHGNWPSQYIDHINGIRTDNRLVNLRNASHAQNHQNRRKAANGSRSGFLGVAFAQGRWAATIKVRGVKVYLGTFDSPEDAHAAYITAKRKLHEFCSI